MADDHDAHDVLLCIGLGKDRSDGDRMRYDRGLYFKSHEEIAAKFPDRPDVVTNTLAIADAAGIEFGKKYHVPSFPLPDGVATENELLVKLAEIGARDRYAGGGHELPAHIKERLDYELGVITKTGYAGYFLIVADFIKAARDRGIPVGPGRGSAAGSLVAYALRITDVCPLTYDLLFERFLNPERVSMPDIDVDFCFERRGEVIDYVRDKYGKDAVGQIVTFGTMKSRAAIKDVGRTLGFTPAETDALAKLIPNQPNFSLEVKEAIEQIPEIKKLYRTDERYRQLLDYAKALEGLSRHTGVHAAGVVIAPGPLDDYVPVCTQETKGSGNREQGTGNRELGGEERVIVTQYDMNALEKAGMLKMDFLGLTTLTVIKDALDAIEARTGTRPDLDRLPNDDPEVYRMLRAGRTIGVFQFESPLATDMLRAIRCDRFDDLVASNALMRPGPLDAGMHRVYQRRKRGEEPVVYALPELEPILEPTYGVITYQEQVMRIAQVLAGISLAEADVLRKAVGKKDSELIKQELGKFVSKAIARGHDKRIIEDIAGQIETFGRYGFNKSHSVAYSVISYHTAWLKAHHPAEFMAALLSSSIGDTDGVVKFINEARELGLEVMAPDVNESGYKFTVVGEKRIRFGLGAIRNVGKAAIESMLAARAEKPFESLFDLCERVDLRLCNKRVFEALVYSGAVDGVGGHRSQYVAVLDSAIQEASLKQQELETGQGSLFGEPGTGNGEPGLNGHSGTHRAVLPNIAPLSETERLTKEKEILGFYISGHPLEPYRTECRTVRDPYGIAAWRVGRGGHGAWRGGHGHQAADQQTLWRGVRAVDSRGFFGIFRGPRVPRELGGARRTGFGRTCRCWCAAPTRSAIRARRTRPSSLTRSSDSRSCGLRDRSWSLFELSQSGKAGTGNGEQGTDAASMLLPGVMKDVRAVAEAHPGAAPLEVRWNDGQGTQARLRSRSIKLSATNAALTELRALLGAERVRLVRGS